MDKSVEATTVPVHHSGAVALRVATSQGILFGVLPGDLVVVQADQIARRGDLVCWCSLTGEASVLRCEGSTLRGSPIGAEQVIEVEENDPGVVGVIVQLQRDVPSGRR